MAQKLGQRVFSVRWKLTSPPAPHGILLLLLLCSQHASAQEIEPRNTAGSVGLIDMPSARMAPDGSLSAGASFFQNTERYSFSFQALPWLETNFRYSGLNNFHPDYSIYWDRSFGIKMRLWDETDVLPTVALGIDDLVGTGIYSGEYLVATKRLGAVDATLGLGWGRLATAGVIRNPLTFISSSLSTRFHDTRYVGQFTFGQYFHGPNSGIFGGLVWHTPLERLNLIAEYSSDAYTLENTNGNFSPRSQFSFGASYRLFGNMVMGLGYLNGRSVVGNFSFQLDPTADSNIIRISPDLTPVRIRTDEEKLHALQKEISTRQVRSNLRGTDLSAMIDALWSQLPAAEDIWVRGNTLMVTTRQADPRNLCAMIAKIAAGYDSRLDGVAVTRSGMPEANCIFPAGHAVPIVTVFAAPVVMSMRVPSAGAMIIPAGVMTSIPDLAAARTAIVAAAQQQNIVIRALAFDGAEVIVYYSNNHYLHEKDAIDRLTRILMASAPSDFEKFRLIASPDGQPEREFDILRGPAERQFDQAQQLSLFGEGSSNGPAPMENPVLAAAERSTYPSFSWSVFPRVRQELFDPLQPFGVQFLGVAGLKVELLRGLSLSMEAEASIYDNFNVSRLSDSVLPHVRTDFLTYFTKGKNGIGQLQGEYDFRIAPTVYAAIRAGYLESMFAGVGGELLWRPEDQRWALGLDLYEVQQRNFDRLFGLQSYRGFTGHISLYYESPWYQLNFKLMGGQYLAGDRGATLEVTRRFASRVEIGAFITKTNVSASQFGEGSFDKGIIIRIPVEWALPINSQSELGMILRPVQRDGGQRLEGDTQLFEATRQASQTELLRDVLP